jgi:hypothetical protein
LNVVLESDVERMDLLNKEQIIIQKQKQCENDENASSNDMEALNIELNEIYERMEQIGCSTAGMYC